MSKDKKTFLYIVVGITAIIFALFAIAYSSQNFVRQLYRFIKRKFFTPPAP